jgi:uncharacterized protein
MDLTRVIAQELDIQPQQVERTVALFAEGATVPFIARYRKDVTGNLDELQIRTIEERHTYLTELVERKAAVLESIAAQDKLTPELKAAIEACTTKTGLEDLYLPYRPKRRTRATIARERGLEPLADRLWGQADLATGRSAPVDVHAALELLARPFVDLDRDVVSEQVALDGARDIIAERIAEDAALRAEVRRVMFEEGSIASRPTDAWAGKTSKFEMYYDFREPAARIPSHRFLAIARGVEEGVLQSMLEVPEDKIVALLESRVVREPKALAAALIREAAADAYQRLMAVTLETDIRTELKDRADTDALKAFQANLRALLLAPPLGGKCVLGLDPGFRTGVKVAVIDATGKYLAHDVIYPVPPMEKIEPAKRTLLKLIQQHRVEAIAIGNGTASRETDAFVRAFLGEHRELKLTVVVVSEAGASVYSASDIAREEFPELDVTIRGAISIGRRLQDPLAELVKIDPKAIGVGQYQHDVNQKRLKKSLEDVVESSVNFVGVEVNTASAALLKHVAGIGDSLARSIVAYRDENGPFSDRVSLRDVPRFGPKAFQQAAGFLRIRGARNPLDNSAVHPEQYPVVERMAKDLGVPVDQLVGRQELLKGVRLDRYAEGDVGEFTLKDIVEELKKPGRDPREQFEAVTFDPNVTEIAHLKEGMVLEGVITNVTDFGCFVDIGVHQDGLVHISRLADRFIQDPKEAVKVGEKVKVKVMGVEVERKRISLSLRQSDITGQSPDAPATRKADGKPAQSGPAQGGQDQRGQDHRGRDNRPGDRRGPPSGRSSQPSNQPSSNQPFNPAFAALANLKRK